MQPVGQPHGSVSIPVHDVDCQAPAVEPRKRDAAALGSKVDRCEPVGPPSPRESFQRGAGYERLRCVSTRPDAADGQLPASRPPAGRDGRSLARCAFLETERRRSRTYPATGYAASPVLKTGWATGPMPLRNERNKPFCDRLEFPGGAPIYRYVFGRHRAKRPYRLAALASPSARCAFSALRARFEDVLQRRQVVP